MSLKRIALTLLVVALLILLGGGAWLYANRHTVVEQQALRILAPYGVATLRLDSLAVRTGDAQLGGLDVRGSTEGYRFQLSLSGIEFNYHWRTLQRGRIESISIEQAVLRVQHEDTVTAGNDDPLSVETLLPPDLLSSLPVETVRIRSVSIDYSNPALPPLSARGWIAIDERLEMEFSADYLGRSLSAGISSDRDRFQPVVRMHAAEKDSTFLALSATPSRTARRDWRWQFAAEAQLSPLFDWQKHLVEMGWLSEGSDALASAQADGSFTLSGELLHPDTLTTDVANGRPDLGQFIADLRLQGADARLRLPDVATATASRIDAAAQLRAGDWSFNLQPTRANGTISSEALGLPAETLNWLGWGPEIPAAWFNYEPLSVQYGANAELRWKTEQLQLELGVPSSQLTLGGTHFSGRHSSGKQTADDAGPKELDLDLTTQINSALRGVALPAVAASVSHRGAVEAGQLKAHLDSRTAAFDLALSGGGNLNTGAGEYKLHLSSSDLAATAARTLPVLEKLGLQMPPLAVSAGTLNLHSTLNTRGWDMAGWRQQATLTLQQVAGNYDSYRFTGLSLNADWTGLELWQTRRPAQLAIESLHTATDITDIQARISLPLPTPASRPALRLDSLSAQLFGGSAYLEEPQTWDFGASTNHFTLTVTGWQLSQLLELQQSEQIEAQGSMQGALPLSLSHGRIIIDGGHLAAASPGGVIRYRQDAASQALASGSEQLGQALELLENFHYDTLGSEVSLDSGGTLLLGLSLAGYNPDQQQGRRVNFNINVEQNIDPLLQSLRTSDSLVEQIEEKVR